LRRVVQHLPNIGVVFALQQRQQRVADAIAREAGVEVALVVAPALAERGEIALDLASGDRKQRSDDANLVAATTLKGGIDASQPACPGAPQELQEHGLRLIIKGVC